MYWSMWGKLQKRRNLIRKLWRGGGARIMAATDPQRLDCTSGLQRDPPQDCLSLRVCSISSYYRLVSPSWQLSFPPFQHCYPRRKTRPSKFQFEEHQGNTLIGQLGVMCPPWANSCDQTGGGLWLAHLNGMPISLHPRRQGHIRRWQHHLDPCPEQWRGPLLKNESAVQWRAGEY